MSARPPLRVVKSVPSGSAYDRPVSAIAPAPAPEGKLMRALQSVVSAYGQQTIPTPRERANLREQLHAAVDVYLIEKLAGK